jgi:hypothetical protein
MAPVATAPSPSHPAPVDMAPAPRQTLVRPWRVFALLSAVGFIASAVHPFRDVDVYWHVRLGKEILDARSITDIGQGWSFDFPTTTWTTTQWLAEILFYALYAHGGWEAIAAFQVLIAVALAVGLAHLLLRVHPSPWASVVYVLVLMVSSGALQERPQLLSMLFTLWLAGTARAILQHEQRSWWLLLTVTAVWANLHGMWVLVPAVMGLLTVGHFLDRDAAGARRCAVLTASGVLGGCLTPVGWPLLFSPLRFAGAGELINEWQPTSFDNVYALLLGVLVSVVVLAWSRASRPTPLVEVVYVVGVVAFALVAVRNVPPAVLLLAPVVTARLEQVFPRTDAVSSEREHRVMCIMGLLALVALPLALGLRISQTPTLPSDLPIPLAQRLAQEPGEHRVLNEYNVSGVLLLWGGPKTMVHVDGRADRYGADHIRSHEDLLDLRGSWRSDLSASTANYAVLDEGRPLLDELRRRGWQEFARHGDYLLLRAP